MRFSLFEFSLMMLNSSSTRESDIIPTCRTAFAAFSTLFGPWSLSSSPESWWQRLCTTEYHDESWNPSSWLGSSLLIAPRRCCPCRVNFRSAYSRFSSDAKSSIACELDSPSTELGSWSQHRPPTAMSWDSTDEQHWYAWLELSLWAVDNLSLWTKS